MSHLRPRHYRNPPVKVRCYLDGLNFYYGVARKYNFKWIDIEALLLELIRQRVPEAVIEKIIIFTAEILPGKKGKEKQRRDRQATYLNALKAHSSRIDVVYGVFKEKETEFEVIEGELKGQYIRGSINQEKQSDVNLAVRMVRDAYEARSDFEIACLVSNDNDLVHALKLKKELCQKVLLITPRIEKLPETERSHRRGFSNALVEVLAEDNPRNVPLKKLIPKIRELIPEVPKAMVLKHPLPPKVGPYEPPASEGWSIQEARRGG